MIIKSQGGENHTVVGYGDPPPGTPPYSYASKIPLLGENGQPQEFGLDQAIWGAPAYFINNQGLVAGPSYTWSNAQGFKWVGTGEIKALNNLGWAAGWMQLSGEEAKPGIWFGASGVPSHP